MIKADNIKKAAAVLETALGTKKYKIVGENEIRLYDYFDNPSEVTYQLNANGVRVSGLSEIGDNLEEYFMNLIGGGGNA